MKVKEILTRHPSCVPAGATIEQAARQMKILDIGMLPVCDENRMIGSITDRDIVIRGVAQALNPRAALVRQIMTEDMVCCFEDQDVEEAARLMEDHHIRRLPVLNERKQLVGIISVSDLATRRAEMLAAEVLARVSMPPALIDQ